MGPVDVIQGVLELGCCLRLDSLEAESEMGIFAHVVQWENTLRREGGERSRAG